MATSAAQHELVFDRPCHSDDDLQSLAFSFAERGRSFLLRRWLASRQGNEISGDRSALELELQEKIRELERAQPSHPSLKTLRDAFENARIERQWKSSVEGPVKAPPALTAEEVAGILVPGESLLAFFPGVGALRGWLFSRSETRCVLLPGSTLNLDSMAEAVWRLRWHEMPAETCEEALPRGATFLRRCPKEGESNLEPSHWLYDQLIAPISGGLTASKRLIILPFGPLHTVPWGALRSPSGRRLVEDFEISIVPSATTLGILRSRGSFIERRSTALR